MRTDVLAVDFWRGFMNELDLLKVLESLKLVKVVDNSNNEEVILFEGDSKERGQQLVL